jgi:hypothetical protein
VQKLESTLEPAGFSHAEFQGYENATMVVKDLKAVSGKISSHRQQVNYPRL